MFLSSDYVIWGKRLNSLTARAVFIRFREQLILALAKSAYFTLKKRGLDQVWSKDSPWRAVTFSSLLIMTTFTVYPNSGGSGEPNLNNKNLLMN